MSDSDFWDIGKAERKYAKPQNNDTAAVPVTDDTEPSGTSFTGRRVADDAAAERRYDDGLDMREYYSYRREYAPSRKEPTPKKAPSGEIIADYQPEGSLIKRVTVSLWQSQFNYYERFRKNAEKSHTLIGRECPKVPFFSYIPQYAQLTRPQAAYYLWFRDRARAGEYLDADFSYVLLYIYEIINLPDKIEAEKALSMLTSLWLAYRDRYIQLDKYMSEWIADFCLVSDLPMPDVLLPLVPQIILKTSFKEFYLSAMLKSSGISPDKLTADATALASVLIDTVSDYDYRTGKYYGEYKAQFGRHTVASVAHAIMKMREAGDELISDGMKPATVCRDAFCGSLCSMNAKKRIKIEYVSFARSYPLRRQLTSMVKYAENKIRAVLHLKSRLACADLDPRYKGYIDEYFAPFSRAAMKHPMKADETPEYEKLYDAIETPFTPENAAKIERDSWEATEMLVEKEEYAEPETAEAPQDEPDEAVFQAALPGTLTGALEAALGGEFTAYCREHSLFEDDAAGRINDFFADMIGDVVLENAGGGYTVIEDYRGEIENWLNK